MREKYGAEGDRTLDPWLAKPVLSQLSYNPTEENKIEKTNPFAVGKLPEGTSPFAVGKLPEGETSPGFKREIYLPFAVIPILAKPSWNR